MKTKILSILISLSFAASAKDNENGHFQYQNNHLYYSIDEASHEEAQVVVNLNQRLIKVSLKNLSGKHHFSFYADRFINSVSDQKIAKEFLSQHQNRLSTHQLGHQLLAVTLKFLLFASPNTHLKSFESNGINAQLRPDQCIFDGETYLPIWDDMKGKNYSEKRTINISKSEMGICGTGKASTGWTWDCLVHDMCHRWARHNDDIVELPPGLGPHCGDEFLAATDDFFLSSISWGCDGKRP